MASVAAFDFCCYNADPAEPGMVCLGNTGWSDSADHCPGGSDVAKTCASDGGRRRAAESVRDRNVSLYRSVCHALFHLSGGGGYGRLAGNPKCRSQSGIRCKYRADNEHGYRSKSGRGCRLAYRYGKRCSFGYRY